jgi:hypothetical protein
MRKLIAILTIMALVICVLPLQSTFADNGDTKEGSRASLINTIKGWIEKGEDYFKEKIKSFSDMGNHWADVTVGKLVELGVINGYTDGTFKPNNTINRAEFAKLLRVSLKLDLIEGNSFKDTANNWAKNEIHTLVVNGGIDKNEYGENFEPYKNITRIEMAKMIVRAVGLNDEAKAKAGQKTKFVDDNSIPYSDRGYIIIASDYKIINGRPDKTFAPFGEATRAEASQMILNMLNAIESGLIEIKEYSESELSNEEEIIKERVDEKLETRKVRTNLPSSVDSSAKHENPKTYEELVENLEELKEHNYSTKKGSGYEFIELDQIISNAEEHYGDYRPYGVIKMEFPDYDFKLEKQLFEGVEYYKIYCDEFVKDEYEHGILIDKGEIVGKFIRIGGYKSDIIKKIYDDPNRKAYYSIRKDLLEEVEYIGFYRPAKYYFSQLDKPGQYTLVVFKNPFKK